jgi:hypothetical protein
MKRLILTLSLAAVALAGSAISLGASASAESVSVAILQQHSFGTIARNSTVCVGPLSPSSPEGVQIFGFTNAATNLAWQVFSVSSQSAPVLVFETTARFVDRTIPPSGNLLYHACVVKRANAPQDYDLTLNSQPVE